MELRAEMNNDAVSDALSAVSPLLALGYQLSDQRVYEQHFGSGWVLLVKKDVRIRIVNDRGLWFVEIGSKVAPEEWFDARLVVKEIGCIPEMGTDLASLTRFCGLLTETAPKWEVLFLPATYATARRSLRAREITSATERFGPP